MNIVLENVSQKHLSVIRELAKALRFKIATISEESSDKELQRRIENVELGQNLVTPDWNSIMNQANLIP
jgi:predicted kinase